MEMEREMERERKMRVMVWHTIDRHQIVIMQATEGRRWYTYSLQVRGLMMHSMLCDMPCR